jgi:hypothetical protein
LEDGEALRNFIRVRTRPVRIAIEGGRPVVKGAEFLPEDVGVVIYIERAKGGTVFGQLMRGSHGVLERVDLRCGG